MNTPAPVTPVLARRRPRRLFIAILWGMALLLIALSGEIGLRVYLAVRGWTSNCYASDVDLFASHPECGVTLRKGFRLRSGAWQITVNQMGLRGPEIAQEKTAGTIRIALVGESSAFGYLVNDGEEAARLLEVSLRDAGYQVEVLNAGVPSYNLFQNRIRFREVIEPLHPDLVLCYLGWNDIGYVVSPEPDHLRYRKRSQASPMERLLAKSVLYTFVTRRLLSPPATLPPAVLPNYQPTTPGENQFRDNLRRLLEEIQHSGAVPVMCGQVTAARPEVAEALRPSLGASDVQAQMIQLGAWLRETEAEIASQSGVRYVDCGDSIPPVRDFLADQVHLTRDGETALARRFHSIVVEELSRLRRPQD